MSGKVLLLNTVITDLYGEPVQVQDEQNPVTKVEQEQEGVFKETPNYKTLTLRDAIILAMNKQNNAAKFDSPEAIDTEVDSYELIEAIYAAEDSVEVSRVQFASIRKDMAKFWAQFGRIRLGKVLKALDKSE